VAERVGGIGAVVAEGGIDGVAVAHLADAVTRQGVSLRAIEGVAPAVSPVSKVCARRRWLRRR
jgi:hypothetical protein